MSSEFMRQVATVLEKVAEHLDQDEYRQQETVQTQRRQMAQTLNEKYAAVTGEELPSDVLDRIASSDANIIRAFERLTEKTAAATVSDEEPETMGESANIDNRTALPASERTKQAAVEADDRFLNWVME